MKTTFFLLLSACIALSLSNPIPEPSNAFGDVVGILGDGRDQFLLVQQQPAEFFVLGGMGAENKKDATEKLEKSNDESGHEDKQPEEQERSFFFKNWFSRPAQPVTTLSVVQQPQMIRLPQPVILGTVYQPISMVTTPVISGALTSGISSQHQQLAGLFGQQGLSGALTSGVSGQQLAGLFGQQGLSGGISTQQLAALFGQHAMTSGTRPSTVTISQPQPSVGIPTTPNGNIDINVQQIVKPSSHQPGITCTTCTTSSGGSVGVSGSGTAGQGSTSGQGNVVVAGSGAVGTSEPLKMSGGSGTINFKKTIDVMGQFANLDS